MTGVRYVCQHCGNEGTDATEDDLDAVLCDVCGEPVTERRDPHDT